MEKKLINDYHLNTSGNTELTFNDKLIKIKIWESVISDAGNKIHLFMLR